MHTRTFAAILDRDPADVRLSLRLRDAAPGRHAFRQPHIAADRRAATDRDAPQDRRAGVDDHVILDDRMARIALAQFAVSVDLEALRAPRDRLIDAHVAADHRRLANDDARAVVDEETLS